MLASIGATKKQIKKSVYFEGFILGIIESLTRGYLTSQLAYAFVFGILIVVLLVKPTGILGKNSKEKV